MMPSLRLKSWTPRDEFERAFPSVTMPRRRREKRLSRHIPVVGIGPGVVYGTNATISDLANALQGTAMARPVVDETGVDGRWDSRFEWTPDSSQFGGRAAFRGPERERPPALFPN